jgi:hypothetical protein
MTTSLPPPASHQPPGPTGPPSTPQGASGQPEPRPAATKPRWRRWWIIVGIAAACVVGAGVLGVGLNAAMDIMDTYSADLTQGSGDFRTIDNADLATVYRADGYHMVAKTPGYVMAGVTTDASHTALAVKVTVQTVTAPAGAEFGPFVLANTKGAGYWLSVDSAGTATLNEIDAKGDVRVVNSAKAPPLGTGTTRTLMLTCSLGLDGTARLGGYVDGTRVITGAPTVKISSVTATGMAGYAKTDVPAEWVATRFDRLGSGDLPNDAP